MILSYNTRGGKGMSVSHQSIIKIHGSIEVPDIAHRASEYPQSLFSKLMESATCFQMARWVMLWFSSLLLSIPSAMSRW